MNACHSARHIVRPLQMPPSIASVSIAVIIMIIWIIEIMF